MTDPRPAPDAAPRPVAVVAGGSAGIGRATAELLAEHGMDVAVLARGEERLRDTERALSNRGARGLGIVCDVSDAEAVMAARRRIVDELGEPDVWVNCAMLTVLGTFDQLDDAEFRAVIDTTFMGQVNGTRAALEGMRPRGRGRIVNIGSGLSYRPVPLQSAYCAAKAAINGFTGAVRSELIEAGLEDITLSLVQLPAVNTPQFDWARYKTAVPPRPAAPVYQPEVAARAVWQAVRDGTRELLVGGATVGLVFGDMLAPGALDHKLGRDGRDMQTEPGHDRPREDNLMGPASLRVGARGSWSGEARDKGVVVDADRARAGIFGGGAALAFAAGVLLGAFTRGGDAKDGGPRDGRRVRREVSDPAPRRLPPAPAPGAYAGP